MARMWVVSSSTTIPESFMILGRPVRAPRRLCQNLRMGPYGKCMTDSDIGSICVPTPSENTGDRVG